MTKWCVLREEARAPSLVLGEDVREEVREGRQAGPRRDRLRTPFLIRCYR